MIRSFSFTLFIGMIVCFSLSVPDAAAQKPYLKFSANYHFGLDSNPVTIRTGNVYPNQTFNLKHERVGINYGKGAAFTGAIGYMFNENVGAELGLSYLKGKNQQAESRFFYPDYLLTEIYRFETYSRMTLINPAVVLTTANGKFKPYARLGLLLAFGKISETEYSSIYTESFEINAQFSGGKGFGFQSAAGATLDFSQSFGLFVELNMNNLNYVPKKWAVTEAKQNKMKIKYDKEITFTDSFTQHYNEVGQPIEEKNAQQIHLPMSTMGIGLGVKVSL